MNSLERRGVVLEWASQSRSMRFLLGVGGGLVAHLEVGGFDVAPEPTPNLTEMSTDGLSAAAAMAMCAGLLRNLLSISLPTAAPGRRRRRLLPRLCREAPTCASRGARCGAVVHHERDAAACM